MMILNNILVGLDLSSIDSTLVQSCISLHQKAQTIKKIILFHNIRYDFLEGNIQLSQSDLDRLKGKIQAVISKKFAHLLDEAGISYQIIVGDENSTELAFLKMKKKHDIQLIVLGLKDPEEGAGIIPQKILATDRERTPLLLIPTGNSSEFTHILGGIDLVDSSRKTIEETYKLAKQLNGSATCLYIYKIPRTYFPYIETENHQIQHQIQKKANKKFQSFVKSIPNDIPDDSLKISPLKEGSVTNSIQQYATSHEIDLILIQRISKANRIGNPIGSVARKFLTSGFSRPLLIL